MIGNLEAGIQRTSAGLTAISSISLVGPTTVVAGAAQAYSATGGTAPYSYSIFSGGGAVVAGTGAFTAPNTVGSVTLRVTDATLTTVDTVITIVPSSATQLVYTTQPGGGGTAVVWSTQPVLEVRDVFGNRVTTGADATATVTLTIQSGTGALSGTAAVAAVAGVVTYSGLSINLVGAKVLRASATLNSVGRTVDSSGFSISATSFTVTALYPTNGANWNDYVVKDGANVYSATDTACVGTETGYWGCIHGGEKRKVVITGMTSCTGLSIADALGAFDWACAVIAGTATFYTTGFKTGKGLRDLVTAGGFINNQVTVSGTASGTSTLGAWWSNAFAALPDNSASGVITLDGTDDDAAGPDAVYASGTILTLSATRATAGYRFGRDKLSIVTLGSAKLIPIGGAGTLFIGNSGAFKHVWVEVSIDAQTAGQGSSYGVMWNNKITFSRVHNSTFAYNMDDAIWVDDGSNNNLFSQISMKCEGCNSAFYFSAGFGPVQNNWLQNVTISGATIQGGSVGGDRFENVSVVATDITGWSGGSAFDIGGNSNNKYVNIRAVGAGANGINFNGSTGNVVVGGLFVGNGDCGIRVGTAGNTLVGVVSAYNNAVGIAHEADNSRMHNAVFVGNGGTGFQTGWNTSTNSTHSHIVATGNVGSGVGLGGSLGMKFTGNLLVGNNGVKNCDVNNGSNQGLVDTTCTSAGTDGSFAYPVGHSSNAILRTGRNAAAAFVGDLVAADPLNATNDGTGSATYSLLNAFDWWTFSSAFSVWQKVTAPGRWAAGTGQIVDYSLQNTVNALLNRTGDGSNANSAFVAGAACPAEANGNVVIVPQDGGAAYLANAFEVMFDDIGNDNGLCETGEACIYTPNFGAYQGHGTLSTCTFNANGGSVTGVTMYGYSNNGY